MQENLLDMKGVAKFLSVSIKQIETFVKDETIPFIMVGKRRRFSPTDVLLSFKHEAEPVEQPWSCPKCGKDAHHCANDCEVK